MKGRNTRWLTELRQEILLSERTLRTKTRKVTTAPQHDQAIVAAAHLRGIPPAAYMMRAAMAMAQHDLELDDVSWEDFALHEASFMAAWDPQQKELHDGAGFGTWKIAALEGETPRGQ